MKLFFREYGEGENTLLILHGLFGMSDNWVTHAKRLSSQFRVIVPDLRNHGMSLHTDVFTYEAMLEDLLELYEDLQPARWSIIGHSMGGKLAMQMALLHPHMVERLIVADISPVAYAPVRHAALIDAMHAIDFEYIKSRQELESRVAEVSADQGIQGLILKNVVRLRDDRFTWKLNLSAISDQIAGIFGFDVPLHMQYHGPVLFIKGATSAFIETEHEKVMRQFFPACRLESIDHAGHWLHAEQPETFYSICNSFLTLSGRDDTTRR